MPFNPQQNGIAEKKSRDEIFHLSRESSSDSKMEAQENSTYESSHLDEQREKTREPSVDLVEKPIKRLHGCSSMSNVSDSKSYTYEEAAKQQVWKVAMENDIWKVILRYQGKLVVTSKWIYEIMLHVES